MFVFFGKSGVLCFVYFFYLFNLCLKLTKTSRINIAGHLRKNIATQI